MDDACAAGLNVLVIVPAGYDRLGLDDLRDVREFFARYTAREPGCGLLAEIGNEENLTAAPAEYAAVFEALAPGDPCGRHAGRYGGHVRSRYGGRTTSRPRSPPGAPPHCSRAELARYPPRSDCTRTESLPSDALRRRSDRRTTRGTPRGIDVTEYGAADAATLSDAIFALDAQPLETIYEYRCQPTDDSCKYGLKDNPPLYDAVAGAFAYVKTQFAARAVAVRQSPRELRGGSRKRRAAVASSPSACARTRVSATSSDRWDPYTHRRADGQEREDREAAGKRAVPPVGRTWFGPAP